MKKNIKLLLYLVIALVLIGVVYWGYNKIKSSADTLISSSICTVNNVCLTMAKKSYALGETVSFALRNNSKVNVILPNSAPWAILDSTGKTVFSPPAAAVIATLAPGQYKKWTWDQKTSAKISVKPGNYSVSFSFLRLSLPFSIGLVAF